MSKILLMIGTMVSSVSFGQTAPASLFEKMIFVRGQQKLPYRLLKPEKVSRGEKYPLIIFLHGAGERGTDNEIQINHIEKVFSDPANRSTYPCYVLAPQCPKNTMWASHERVNSRLKLKSEPSPVMTLLTELIQETEEAFPVDRDRIYVTGLSMGGFGTWELIARYPERFAAAVPVCGGGDVDTAADIRHIPLWAFHGALDEVVLPSNSRVMIRALQESGARPGYTEYPGVGHESWVHAYREPYLFPWLFDQARNKKNPAK